jgi:hypothetical protein
MTIREVCPCKSNSYSMRTIKILSLLLLLLAVNESYSQGGIFSKRNIINQYSTVGFGGGSSHYWGDLSPFKTFYLGLATTPRWNGTINYTRFLTPNFGARFSFSYIRIMGDDYTYFSQWNLSDNVAQYRFLRNLHFRNDIKEFTLTGIYNFTNQNGKGPKNRVAVVPYVFGGFGFYNHNPIAKSSLMENGAVKVVNGQALTPKDTEWSKLAGQKTGGQANPYGAVQLCIPVGIGVRKRINEQFDIAIEGSLRYTPFDYLDDVSEDVYQSTPATTPRDQGLSNRSFENLTARKGKDRKPEYNDVLGSLGFVSGTFEPYGNTLIGGGSSVEYRGTKSTDFYATVQITLNYILSNKIKCPPIR